MTILRSATALLGAVALAACGDTAVQDITGPLPSARIKFFNFGVNAPGVNFYLNDAKITAITSATGVESTTGTASGLAASGGFYSGIAPGQYTVTGKIAATVDKDLVVATVPVTIADGKFYSVYLSGIYNTTAKTVEGFVVEDPVEATIDFAMATVRFVHGISNADALTLYARNTVTTTEVAVGSSIAYKAAGAFTKIPAGVYDLGARYVGNTTNAFARTGVSFLAGRVYTVGARGDITVTSTTLATRPQLDNTANR